MNKPAESFTTDRARELAAELWGVQADVTRLGGWEDSNFLLRQSEGDAFVLKISPQGTPRAVLDNQAAMLQHLAAGTLAELVPRIVPTVRGAVIGRIDTEAGPPRWARLLTYLEGRPLVNFDNRPAPLLAEIGRTLAALDLELARFEHPATRVTHEWDLMATPELTPFARFISDPTHRAMVESGLDRFSSVVLSRRDELEPGAIHGDPNDHNLLVVSRDRGLRLSGIIDLSDLVISPIIADLAICLAYLTLDRDDPVSDATLIIRGYNDVRPLTALERELLPDLVTGRVLGSILHAAHGLHRDPDNEYLQISAAPMWRWLERMSMNGTHPLGNSVDAATGTEPRRTIDEILEVRRRHLGRNLSISYTEPLKIVRGEGQYLFDDHGRRYLDLVNNVCHVGHCHPRVVAAGQRQMAELNTNTRYLHDHLAEYALRLTDSFPDPLCVCYFVCTGTEANDLALRLARSHTGTREIIVLEHAYHGHSPSLIEIGTYKCEGPGGEGLAAHAHKAPIPDGYRGIHRGPGAGARYADEVRKIVDSQTAAGRPPGAFMAESLIGCGGQIIPAEGFMAGAFDAVRSAGGVCIADEVQVGFGRAGSHFWAFEALDVVPDIVTLGKPIGNGHPMAAVVTTPEIAGSFVTGMEYFNTFGGNPVSCAIGLAVLDVIESEGLQEHARVLGRQFLDGFRDMAPRHPLVGDVRGLGLFLGVELVRDHQTLEPADTEASAVVDAMRHRGFLLSTDGPFHNVIKIKPPMVLTSEDVSAVLSNIDEVLTEIETGA